MIQNTFELIDSHCHLDFPVFDESRVSLLEECANKGIKKFIVPGVTAATWHRLQCVCEKIPVIYPAYGLHPSFIQVHKPEDVDQLKILLKQNFAIAVGEIGLDYYLPGQDKKTQQWFFDAQLALADELGLPVILHVRKAHDDVLLFLKQHHIVGGVVHAFNGSLQQAHRYLDFGFKLGFGGALTFENANHLRRLVSQLPLEAIVLETDSPDMMPSGFTESANTPLTILAVLAVISDIRKESLADVAKQTTSNIHSLFKMPY